MSFDDRSVNGGEDAIHENTPLIDGLEPTYRRISTTPYIVLHIILTVVLFHLERQRKTFIINLFRSLLSQWLFYFLRHWWKKSVIDQYRQKLGIIRDIVSLCIFMRVLIQLVWYLIGKEQQKKEKSSRSGLTTERMFSIYHHYQDLSRRDGYLEFYRQTRNLRRTPLFIVSTGHKIEWKRVPLSISILLGNAMLVAFILLMERIQASHNDCKVGPLEPYYYLIILAGVETLINLIALIWYLSKWKPLRFCFFWLIFEK